ncbi:MAG TPA: 5-deoxy-glucuronate isomerase [Acetobacteraceae bacterium]|nr:5-deoxy-glucuronate isomerase [Acetobacteraceae bacterium]
MSRLLVRPAAPDSTGRVLSVSPESAGWTYVGFEVFRWQPGQSLARQTGDREACLVVLSGTVSVRAGETDLGRIGGRASPFDGPPHSAYIPAGSRFTVVAETMAEVAVCTAPGSGGLQPRVIAPAQIVPERRGTGTNLRIVHNILPESEPAESLLVVEVLTPAGHWSSYPPHKHDRDAPPAETLLEETYYHRINPPQGFAFQRIYTDDRSLDEALVVQDGDCVLVPRGYHPVGAAHGYDLYYLNVMAGPRRAWRFHNDPAHEWMLSAG